MGGRSLAVISSALYRNSCIKGRLAKGHPSALCHYYVCKLAARFSTPERRYNIARRFFLLRPLLPPPPARNFYDIVRALLVHIFISSESFWILVVIACLAIVFLWRENGGAIIFGFSRRIGRENVASGRCLGRKFRDVLRILIRSIFSTERNDILWKSSRVIRGRL